jgi:hypothetical protein
LISVSGDSWEREFDESDLNTSKIDTIPLTVPTEKSTISAKKADNEFDDDWESWS